MTEAKNLFNLPPDMFDLVCEKIKGFRKDQPEYLESPYSELCPDNPEVIYRILCAEIEIQVAGAYEHPEKDGRFQTIMQCALILESLRKDAAVRMKRICKECFEPLTNDGDGTTS